MRLCPVVSRYLRRVIEELVLRLEAGDDSVVDELADLAAADPILVAPYALRLVDAGVAWRADVLYRAGDEHFQRELVGRIDGGAAGRPALLVYLLAQAPGPETEAAFRRWMTAPPPGIDPYGRGIAALVRDGGWELSQGSGRRALCGTSAYRLDSVVSTSAAKGVCPWCRSFLWTALDLQTSESAVAKALAHTGWQGKLRIDICAYCVCYGPVYVNVTADGGSSWSKHTVRPGYLPDDHPETPPQARFTPGARRPTEHLASAWEAGGSTLGGFPDWIQDPAYPLCLQCHQAMDYVGLINGSDLWDGEGAYYLFLHAPCGLAAADYQQS